MLYLKIQSVTTIRHKHLWSYNHIYIKGNVMYIGEGLSDRGLVSGLFQGSGTEAGDSRLLLALGGSLLPTYGAK